MRKLKTRSLSVLLALLLLAAICVMPQTHVHAAVQSGMPAYHEELSNQQKKELLDDTNTYEGSNPIKIPKPQGRSTDQYQVTYDMTTKKAKPVEASPQITVLTHGHGVGANTWSNLYSASNKSDVFAYDPASMIQKISDKAGGANIYWAQMQSYENFKLIDIKDDNYNPNKTPLPHVADISKHTIIVFEAHNPMESNDNIYYQLNFMLSRVIYDIRGLNGGVLPKVNLIGHSRGGLTNLQYALDHPDLVDSLVSVGTPYFGSSTLLLFDYGTSDGKIDVLNSSVYNTYLNTWNTNYNSRYKNINAWSIGGYMSFDFLAGMAINDRSGSILQNYYLEFAGLLGILASILPLAQLSSASKITAVNYIMDILSYLSLNEVVTGVMAEMVFNELVVTSIEPANADWKSDAVVPLDSQLGKKNNVPQYSGFKLYERYFKANNTDFTKVSVGNLPPAGHNLEARDPEIINKIVNNSGIDFCHNYTHHYIKYSSSSHTSYCACGAAKVVREPHTFRPILGRLGWEVCTLCGYERNPADGSIVITKHPVIMPESVEIKKETD